MYIVQHTDFVPHWRHSKTRYVPITYYVLPHLHSIFDADRSTVCFGFDFKFEHESMVPYLYRSLPGWTLISIKSVIKAK
jgi:hypothetical protein